MFQFMWNSVCQLEQSDLIWFKKKYSYQILESVMDTGQSQNWTSALMKMIKKITPKMHQWIYKNNTLMHDSFSAKQKASIKLKQFMQ